MRTAILFFLLFFGVQICFGQPEKKADSITLITNLKKLDESIKEVSELSKKVEKEEIKRMSIFQKLKNFIYRLGSKTATNKKIELDSLRVAWKPEEFQPIPAQTVRKEQRPKSFLGRLFSKKKYREFSYVLDADSSRIYLSK